MPGPARPLAVVVACVAVLAVSAPGAGAAATFSAPTGTPLTGISPQWSNNAVPVDLNNDGHLDVAFVEFQNSTPSGSLQVDTLRGDGTGAFSFFPFSTGLPGSQGLAAYAFGNISPDTLPDLLAGNPGGTFRLATNVAGGFPTTAAGPAGITAPQLADLNGDGRDDLVYQASGTTIEVRLNNGGGGFLPVSSTLARSPAQSYTFPFVGDVTGDGKPDIVSWSYADGKIAVFPNDGAGGFPTTPPQAATQLTIANSESIITGYPNVVSFTDVNGDGARDMIVSTRTPDPATLGATGIIRVRVALNSGAGTFAAPGAGTTFILAGGGFSTLGVGDFDLDGRPDVAVAEGLGTSPSISILYNTGSAVTPLAGPSPAYSAPAVTSSPVVGDFDENGAPDIGFLDTTGTDLTFRLLRNQAAAPVRSAPASVAFPGTVPLGTLSAPQTVTVTNTGGGTGGAANLKITSASASGDFLKTGDTCTGVPVAKNASCTITLRFAPSAEGPRSGALTITDNSAASPGTISLSGNGAGIPTGAAGVAGLPGPTGPAGSNGVNGRNGRDATVTCKPGKLKGGKVRITCSVKLAKAAVRARLSRAGVVVARGTVRGGVARFDTRGLRPGRYTLTVVVRHGGRIVRDRTTVTLS